MNWLGKVLGITLVAAEGVVPVFIHNPQSQQIEGVIITTVNSILQALSELNQNKPPAQG